MVTEKVARLAVEIGANISPLRRGISKVTSVMGKLRKSVLSVKGALVGLAAGLVLKRMKDFVTSIIDLGDKFAKTSKILGIGTETLGGLKFAAELAGSSFEAVTKGFKRLSAAASDANDGLAESQRAFDKLGVIVTDGQGNLRKMEDIFFDVADAMANMTNDTQRAAIAQDVFGRAGLELIPLLKQGSKEIKRLIRLAKEMGVTFSQKDAKAAEEFKDQLFLLNRAFSGFASKIVKQIAPAFAEFFKALRKDFTETSKSGEEFTSSISKFIKGLLFTTIAAVEIMKTVWNGLKLIWKGLQVAWVGIQSIIISGTIQILDAFRSLILAIQKPFDKVFDSILKGFQIFSKALVSAITTVTVTILDLVSAKLFKLSQVAGKLPFKAAQKFSNSLSSASLSAGNAAEKVLELGKAAQRTIEGFEGFKGPAKAAVTAIDQAVGSLGEKNEELRLNLISLKLELDKLAETEAIPFWERAKELIIALNDAINEQAFAIQRIGEEQEKSGEKTATFAEKLTEVFKKMSESGRAAFGQMAAALEGLIGAFSTGLARAAVFGESFKESMIKTFKDLAASLIAQLVKILVTALAVVAVLSILGLGGGIAFGDILKQIAFQQKSFLSFFEPGELALPGTPGFGLPATPSVAVAGKTALSTAAPLGKAGMFGASQTVIIELDGRMIAETTVENMPSVLRVQAGLA